MSFSTPFESRVICPLADESYELLDRVPSESESGWDSMRDTYLVRNDAAGLDPNSACPSGFARGDQISGLNMWIVSRSAKVLARGLFKIEIVAMGLLSARGYKVTYDAAAASQTAENCYVGTTLYPKVAAREGGVTATFEYVLIGSGSPTSSLFLTESTGRAKSPPTGWEPSIPAEIWSYLAKYVYNHPNGWIFEGAGMENLPGLNSVWLVKEKYAYQRAITPG